MYTVKRKDRCDVQCYGELEPTSNFEVVCDDEYDDYTETDIDEEMTTWEEIVEFIQQHCESDVVEITSV